LVDVNGDADPFPWLATRTDRARNNPIRSATTITPLRGVDDQLLAVGDRAPPGLFQLDAERS
jgi:hypothetical protein